MPAEPVLYTRDEILSFLPLGWVLPADEEGRPTDDGGWTATVLDVADQRWPVEVTADQVEALGRVAALQEAFARLHRRALGRAGLFG